MADFDAIDDRLMVGSAFEAEDVPMLVDLGVGAVVSLQAEMHDPVEELGRAGIACVRVECEDFRAPSPAQLSTAVEAVDEFIKNGRRVYLHCYAGLQRSVTVAACYYIWADPQRYNARTAIDFVCARRRNACPLREQKDAILEFDRLVRAMRGI
jgi:protein-tyrosine phosphatase